VTAAAPLPGLSGQRRGLEREWGDQLMSAVAAVVTGLVASLLLLGSNTLARRVLDRRRLNAWDAEWRVTGPLWSGHRS
jgi:hypothetical protein